MGIVATRAVRVLGALAAGAIALAGCAPSAEAPTEPSAGASQASPAPASPMPTLGPSEAAPPAEPGSDPATWIVDLDGVGPIRVGGSIAEASDALVAAAYATQPPGSCESTAVNFASARAAPIVLYSDEGTDRMGVVTVGGGVLSVEQRAGSPRTIDGIGIGSTLADVQSAFPGGSMEEINGRFVVSGNASSGSTQYLTFLFFEGAVEQFTVQERPTRYWDFC
ncbi:MAG TPA: hypothetical protein PKH61_02000 [Microbacteriaceae bacterium]|nr:hypothetical protein [Microbacteriaceae bacterium]